MRMKHRRVRTIKISNKAVTKDKEGVPVVTYGDAQTFHGEVWPASNRLQVETYGDRIKGIMNVRLRGEYTAEYDGNVAGYKFDDFVIREGDGVYVNATESPDYRVISITAYRPLRMEVERL